MSSMFRSSEKTCKKWSLKCLVFLWTNVDLQFLEMFGWDTSCNISNVPHDCPLFSEHEHVRGDTIDWSTEWRRKKKKIKRDQCRNQISMSCSSFQKAKLLAASSSSQAVAQHGILASWASYGEIFQIITFDKEWRQILASSPDFGFWRHVTNSKLKEMIDVWLKWEKEKEVKQPAFS